MSFTWATDQQLNSVAAQYMNRTFLDGMRVHSCNQFMAGLHYFLTSSTDLPHVARALEGQ